MNVFYYVNPNAADQGVVSPRSCKAIIDGIGTKQATMIFPRDGVGDSTTYTFSTDVTIPSNIKVEIEKGAILSIANTKTLTINGPFDAGLYQVFSGDGSVVFGSGAVAEVYPEWWGAKGDGATDDSDAISSALNHNYIEFCPEKTYIIDTISKSGAGSFELNLNNSTLKHKSSSVDDMLIFSAALNVTIRNGNIDGNYTNQTDKRILINAGGSSNVFITNVHFSDVHTNAINVGKYNDEADLVNIENCTFTDGVLHEGILNGIYCHFIHSYPVKNFIVNNCRFIQTADPAAGESRNPSAIFCSSTSPSKYMSVSVTNCYFENLGHHVAGNIAAGVDVYGYRDAVIYENNIANKPRMMAFRITNFKTASVKNNTIYQNVDNIIDGGSTYTSAASIVVSLVSRGYVDNQRINASAQISNNTIVASGSGGNLSQLILAASDSTLDESYYYDNVKIDNNAIYGNANNTGVVVSGVAHTTISNNIIDNTNIGVKIVSTLLASISSLIGMHKIIGNTFRNNATGFFLRESTESPNVNCHVWVENNSFESSNLAFTVRYVGNVYVLKNIMPAGNNGDAYHNSSFFYKNNAVSYVSDPVGYTTNTYYTLFDNIGQTDAHSS